MMTTTTIHKSQILTEIAASVGSAVPLEDSKIQSFVRQARKNIVEAKWNSLSPETQKYLETVTKCVAAKKEIPFPPDFEKTGVPKTKLTSLKEKMRAIDQQVKEEKEKRKQERALQKKELKKTERASKRKTKEADVEEELEELEAIPNNLLCNNAYKPYNVSSLLELYKHDRIKLPKFQRKSCWDTKMRSEFIEDFLSTMPVHALILAKEPNSKEFYLLDGFQRMTAFTMFSNNLCKAFGRNYANMKKELQNQFLTTDIPVVECVTEKINWRLIFHKINRNGMPLNDTEIRRAIYEDLHLMFVLEDFTENNSVWLSIFGGNMHYKGLGSMLRAVAMHYCYQEYQKPVAKFLDTFCNEAEKLCNDGTISVNTLQLNLQKLMLGMDLVHNDQGQKKRQIFRMTEKSQINLGLVDCMIHAGLKIIENNSEIEPKELAKKLEAVKKHLLETSSTYAALTSNTSSNENVNTRLAAVDKFLS
jgi:flagellar motor switch/type III secretory pathway protein FliN